MREEEGRRKEEGGRRKEEGGRRKEEGGRRKEGGGARRCSQKNKNPTQQCGELFYTPKKRILTQKKHIPNSRSSKSSNSTIIAAVS